MFVSISLSAKRCAYCPSPSAFSHSAIGCIADTDFLRAGTVYPVLCCKERHTRDHWAVRPTIGIAEQATPALTRAWKATTQGESVIWGSPDATGGPLGSGRGDRA